LLLKLYSACFATIKRNLEKKLGADNGRINKILNSYNSGVWGFFLNTGQADFNANLAKFKRTVEKIPREVQVYKLLSGLNQILVEQMSLLQSYLGQNIRRQVISEIKKEVAMPLAEKRDINKKYGIESDLFRALKEYRQVVNQ